MKLPDDVRSAAICRGLLTVSIAAGVSACAGGSPDAGLASASDSPVSMAQRTNGPAADYPVMVGDPYQIGAVEFVPQDTLNYDLVGYLAVDQGAMGYSGAHHTLPLPSYVEVTSLDTGRTVLVRLERRGPMASNHLLALSPAAMAQLGATVETPVRVRRVNPPEDHRYLLRSGEAAPLRMDTPTSLLTVLQRRLPEDGGASLRAANMPDPLPTSAPVETNIETVELAASEASPAPQLPPVARPAPTPVTNPPRATTPALPPLEPLAQTDRNEDGESPQTDARPAIAPSPAPVPAAEGNFVVQAAAFSTMERAQRAAHALGGTVTPSGQYFRVRTGPFTTRGEAEASLANVRRAGYSDARILTNG